MFQEFADVVAVVGFVHHGGVQPARFWNFSPNIGEGSGIMALSSAQAKRNGDSFIGASGMQFGRPSAAGFSYRLLGFAAAVLRRAGGMLMRSNDGRINEKIAHRLGVEALEMLPNLLPKSRIFPTAESFVSANPTAEFFRQISPRISRSGLIEDGFHEHSVAEFGRAVLSLFEFFDERFNGFPKFVANQETAG